MKSAQVNEEQASIWNGDEGLNWLKHEEHFNRAIGRYGVRLLELAGISGETIVLDVGCGCGETTRKAARLAGIGSVLGIDLSRGMIQRARERTLEEGLRNVTFEAGDAQTHPFEDGRFDLVISRFGVMFFGDPVAAFGNIRAGVRQGGRLAVLAWQPLSDNEWQSEIRAALAQGRALVEPASGQPGPFGLSDRSQTTRILESAGWTDITFESIREPYVAGATADDAFEFATSLGVVRTLLEELGDEARQRALDDLRLTLERHETTPGVVFDSAAWLIAAKSPLS